MPSKLVLEESSRNIFLWERFMNHEAIEASRMWYRAIRRATGCPVILESTKDPRRLKMLYIAMPDGRVFPGYRYARDG